MNLKYTVTKEAIHLQIPITKPGRLRFKKRDDRYSFGRSFAAQKERFDDNTYLEWQIGYDVTVEDFTKGKKHSEITSDSFVGANGKEKYPYELSELLFIAMELGLLPVHDVEGVLTEISGYRSFIDEKPIAVGECVGVKMNGLEFKEACVMLPTFFMTDTADGTQIEVSMEKQQYATGVQPMLYYCIPLAAFSNAVFIRGRSSVKGDVLVYVIDKLNAGNLAQMMRVFAMSSKRHLHDVSEILKLLIRLAKK